ncbi:MAG: 50S ribosomal protein L17 [Firmicutes bacterium]|nr:50S ribosomal protein L17 [Bacillota bacterium]
MEQRRALFRALATALFREEKIETTEAKAHELRPIVEKMITDARTPSLAAKRRVIGYLTDEDISKKLFDTIAPRYQARQGGYTRIIKVGPRRGDAAPMAIIELV